MTSERDFQQAVMDLLKLRGWIAYHTFRSDRSEPGFPDIVALRNGKLLALELKSAKGRLTQSQIRWLDQFAKVPGCTAGVVRPADDWTELEAVVA